MSIKDILNSIERPVYHQIEYNLRPTRIEEEHIVETVLRSLRETGVLSTLHAGDRVAIAVGSREITNLQHIVSTLVAQCKASGAKPFIVPAMGSHGGGTAEGQRCVLAELGINETSVGAPVYSSMEVDALGKCTTGMEVFTDRIANTANWIIPVARIKPHTDFHGEIESGIMKMLTVGLGKQQGAQSVHARGWACMEENICAGARVLLASKVAFAIGIVENSWHETMICEAIPANRVEKRERELLRCARENLLRIPFDKVDVLILERMGKEISGSGMDPNVTGRSSILGISRPNIDCIAVFDLTEASHRNATGVGKANVISKRLFQKMDKNIMYLNGLTGNDMRGLEIPVVMPDDQTTYLAALRPCWGVIRTSAPRVVWLRDTMSLKKFYISESLVDQALANADLVVSEERFQPSFDMEGQFNGFDLI